MVGQVVRPGKRLLRAVQLPDALLTLNLPKAGAYALPAGFAALPPQGFIVVKYAATTVAGTDQFPFALHNGTTQNQLALRVFTDNTQRIRHLKAGVDKANLQTMRSDATLMANQIVTAAYSWDAALNRQASLFDGVYQEDFTQTALASQPLTTLQVGGRNAGADPLSGYIISVQIGDVSLTQEQMMAFAYRNAFVIGMAGQSNAANYFSKTSPYNMQGRNALMSTLLNLMLNREIVVMSAAVGGTPLLAFNDVEGRGFWWDHLTDQPGPLLLAFYAKTRGLQLNAFLWLQGEADAFGAQTKAEYKAALLKMFQHVRTTYPGIPIIIGHLARRTGAFNAPPQYQMIAECQSEIVDSNNWASLFEVYDQPMQDSVHLSPDGYTGSGGRAGKHIARLYGALIIGGTQGPKLASASRSSLAITAQLQHDGGTDITPTSGIEGFTFLDGDIAASGITITTTNGSATIIVNHAGHGLSVNDIYTADGSIIFNGIKLAGKFAVTEVPNANSFKLFTRGGPANASGTSSPLNAVYNKLIALSDVNRASVNSVTMNLARLPAVLPGRLYYGFDAMIGINTANILKDNSVNALPMQRGSVSVA